MHSMTLTFDLDLDLNMTKICFMASDLDFGLDVSKMYLMTFDLDLDLDLDLDMSKNVLDFNLSISFKSLLLCSKPEVIQWEPQSFTTDVNRPLADHALSVTSLAAKLAACQ